MTIRNIVDFFLDFNLLWLIPIFFVFYLTKLIKSFFTKNQNDSVSLYVQSKKDTHISKSYPHIELSDLGIIRLQDVNYPPKSIKKKQQGDAVVKILINEFGHVSDSELLKSTGYDNLDESALECCEKYLFVPHKINEIPSSITTNLLFKFRL